MFSDRDLDNTYLACKRLMFCVLERSLKDICKYVHPSYIKSSSYQHYWESLCWIKGEDRFKGYEDHLFSFKSVCDVLHLDAPTIRKRIIDITEYKHGVPEQLLGGSLWKHYIYTRGSVYSTADFFEQSSPLLLYIKQISAEEDEWVSIPETERIQLDDPFNSEEDDTSGEECDQCGDGISSFDDN